ncbi:DMT family transporter [Clostridium sp. SM-530-WT-3G]|uniref:DMT family transporter n=1 Tax=Clostridium sp. SM-530-WT-3G TaxID=2725303 RepID=UPI00145CC310|nr:DMT family transporter [Clostridium sp. SM-530-WT-3G]NME81597.1 DMT family transporter [Clostridium sp. SM-530-WT-3G]
MSKYKGIIFAILSSISYAIMPVFAKIAYNNGSTPTTTLFFRFLITAIVLFLYTVVRKENIKVSKKQFLILFFTGFIGYTLTTELLFLSYDYLSIGLATTLHYIYPAVVCILSYFILKEKITLYKIISLCLSLLGVYSLIAFENTTLNTFGIIIALLSGICYATNVIGLSLKSIKNLSSIVITMFISLGASAGLLLYGFITKDLVFTFNSQIIFSYVGLSIISTIFSILFLIYAIELIGSTSASILGTFEAVLSIIFGIIFLNESVSIPLICGCALIVTSTIVLTKDKSLNSN